MMMDHGLMYYDFFVDSIVNVLALVAIRKYWQDGMTEPKLRK